MLTNRVWQNSWLFLSNISPKTYLYFRLGIVACACLDTSRLATLAEPSTRHGTTKRKKENPKPSDAESSAKPLGRSPALTLGGFWDL